MLSVLAFASASDSVWPDRPMTLQAQEYPISLRSPGLQTWCPTWCLLAMSTRSEFCVLLPPWTQECRHTGPTAMQNRDSGYIQYTSFKSNMAKSCPKKMLRRVYLHLNNLLPLGHAISAALILKRRGVSPTLNVSCSRLETKLQSEFVHATTALVRITKGLRNSEWFGSAKVALFHWLWFLSSVKITRMQPEHSQYQHVEENTWITITSHNSFFALLQVDNIWQRTKRRAPKTPFGSTQPGSILPLGDPRLENPCIMHAAHSHAALAPHLLIV